MAAMEDFEALFPNVPSSADGGARDDRSTYRHLPVCDMEYQALTALVGEGTAREALAGITHYEWIYQKVLNDLRIPRWRCGTGSTSRRASRGNNNL